MRPRTMLCSLLLCGSSCLFAVQPGKILPTDVQYDPSIPSPADHFGFEVGTRHLLHHELVGYCRQLAAVSDRVTIQEYGRSHGGRPLVMLFITSPDNHRQLESMRLRHAQLSDAETSDGLELTALPAIINMGYSVHGNEPSGSNAAPLVAYHLAAATGEEHRRLLDQVVVLLDPSLNPDGFERAAHWVNNHRGNVLNPDPSHREHREPSPNGRTNYYWFDLNRDWLPVQHPESQGRLRLFHHFKPNVLLDFHEMGTDSTFFFQPGVVKRNHPLIPYRALELTREFASHHAAALDAVGSLYYTEERYDDFYMGKGSTYPDLHGSIGILFEQASARGHLQDSINGPLSFAFAIRNQFLTSLSSLNATLEHRLELLEHMRTFYQDSAALARNHDVKGYVVATPDDPARLHHFLEVLARHQIHAYQLETDFQAGGHTFRRGESYAIPTAQPEFRFLQALFERRTEFAESIFYDVSTWTLPLAFNVLHGEVDNPFAPERLGEMFSPQEFPTSRLEVDERDLGYVVDWRGYYAPKTLYQLLSADVKVKVATEPLRLQSEATEFSYGTLLVPMGIQPEKREQVVEILEQATDDGVHIYAAASGLTPEGIDFGSSSFVMVPKPKFLLLAGSSVSGYEAGEAWHLLDRRFGIPVTLVDGQDLSRVALRDYSVVTMVSGSYSSIPPAAAEQLKAFVAEGGTLVAIGSAIRWLNRNEFLAVDFRQAAAEDGEPAARTERRPYAAAATDAAVDLVRGSILRAHVDHTHPIGYGFTPSQPLPVFRNNTVFLDLAENAYSSPVVYDAQPLLSGYVSAENLDLLSGSAGVVVRSSGRGRIIMMADNPNFRAFWYGTNRLFLNALLFGPIIRVP